MLASATSCSAQVQTQPGQYTGRSVAGRERCVPRGVFTHHPDQADRRVLSDAVSRLGVWHRRAYRLDAIA